MNLHDVRAYRGAKASRAVQASKMEPLPQIDIDFDVGMEGWHDGRADRHSSTLPLFHSSLPIEPRTHEPEEEIALGSGLLALGLSTQVWCSGVFHPALWGG